LARCLDGDARRAGADNLHAGQVVGVAFWENANGVTLGESRGGGGERVDIVPEFARVIAGPMDR